jgi:hypothetical protein
VAKLTLYVSLCFGVQICEDDIECHSYEEISTEPAIKIENTTQVS